MNEIEHGSDTVADIVPDLMVPKPYDAPAQGFQSAVPFGIDSSIKVSRLPISLHVNPYIA